MSAYDDYFAHSADRSEASARVVAPIVMEVVRPKSVVDVGCGVGAWLKVFSELGAEDILGIDADYVPAELLRIPVDCFQVADLRFPFDMGRRFDLAVCLEVGEHLPHDAAVTFVEMLAGLAPVVLFSAAPPGQGGIEHVNEQWPDYWAGLFARHGLRPVDAIRDRVWNDERVEWWYRQNVLLYAADLPDVAPDPLRRIVHPQKLIELQGSRPDELGVRHVVRELQSAVGRAVRRRLAR